MTPILTKYHLIPLATRILIMGLPALLNTIFEYLADKSESLLIWLDSRPPDPVKKTKSK